MAETVAVEAPEPELADKASEKKEFPWVNAILEEITRLAQIENADVVDKLRLAKKFE
ncbi:unnamed protein product, partial [Allacma fusca]